MKTKGCIMCGENPSVYEGFMIKEDEKTKVDAGWCERHRGTIPCINWKGVEGCHGVWYDMQKVVD